MLGEVLMLLGGYPSSFFIPHPPTSPVTFHVSPALSEYLHPGEIASLNSLASLAFRYRRIKTWAEETLRLGQEAVLAESLKGSRKGKQRQTDETEPTPNQYLATLAGSVLEVLSGYDLLIVETEAKILTLDPELVQDSHGYVPLSSIVATFDKWQAPLSALAYMVAQLSGSSVEDDKSTPGKLIDLIYAKSQTGNPSLEEIFQKLASSLRRLFQVQLVSFLLFGIAPSTATPTSPALGLNIGADPLSPQHRLYALNDELLPSSITGRMKEGILYVGRVACTLKTEGRSLPKPMIDALRQEIMSVKGLEEGAGLEEVIEKARAEVGEWLWKHILTGPQVVTSIETFGNYFLLRKTDYSISVIREISQLRFDKLITSNPHSSSSVIREQDLDQALRRASIGTTAGMDHGVENLRYRMERGPLRTLLSANPSKISKSSSDKTLHEQSSIRNLFSSFLLGTPITLTNAITWPLDLFMTPPALAIYSDVHAYLIALRKTHTSVLSCWTSLSAAQRRRRKWTSSTEGGTADEAQARKRLARITWGTVQLMLFFIDQLQSHFMTDIIDVQHKRLLEQLDLEVSSSSSTLGGSLRGSAGGSSRGSVRGSILAKTSPAVVKAELVNISSAHGIDKRQIAPCSETQGGLQENQSLKSNRAPPVPKKGQNTYLDFLTLRRIHTRHLSFLLEGLLISDIGLATVTRDILLLCERFTNMVERWGGDVLPELLMEGMEGERVGKLVHERAEAIVEINESLRELLMEFFGTLLDTENPITADADKSIGAGGSLTRTIRIAQISRVMSRQTSFTATALNNQQSSRSKMQTEKEERNLEAEAAMSKHVEQLLLRLDFNSVLSTWRLEAMDGEYRGGSVLAEGGL
ncbi:hypothetical protein L204_101419 [Cryptococcus depauperatus]|nr:hypothetical protein L204_04090 [Cryptococcus depauperatus CBS 7855]